MNEKPRPRAWRLGGRLDFQPQAGHEQAGRRSRPFSRIHAYNAKVGLAVCCPLTLQVKDYPGEVAVDATGVKGVLLADQIKKLDWRVRRAEFSAGASEATVAEVGAKIRAIME